MNKIINATAALTVDPTPSTSTDKAAKKRVRRKPRKKQNSETSSCQTFESSISRISGSSNGVFIKKSVKGGKKINSGLFETGGAAPCEFVTKVDVVGKETINGGGGSLVKPAEVVEKHVKRKFPVIGNIKKKNHVIKKEPPTATMNNKKPSPYVPTAGVSGVIGVLVNGKVTVSSPQKKKPLEFAPYWETEAVLAGIADGTLVKGVVRINPKFYTDAYVTQDDRSQQDYLIGSLADRNKALEGDVVALQIHPADAWKDNQKTARVVYILEKVHKRIAVGELVILKDKNKGILVQPRDRRVPRMEILQDTLPPHLLKTPQAYLSNMFLVQLVEWKQPGHATGKILENLGKTNDFKVETKAILLENSIDFTPFPPEIAQYVPKTKKVTAEELAYREDLRKECIFTIDPATAKDLDDAMSCKKLPNGNFEVGVHIADVAFYLHENTPLDELVKLRATSTYLVDKVYHMLPPEMTMMCSLLPGRDCLAFSVIWEMDEDAEIVSTRFTRSVINSCSQFSYEHAQFVIENPSKGMPVTMFPRVHNNFILAHLGRTILDLQGLAVRLRQKRINNGALRIDQIKMGFVLDPLGNPESFYVQEQKDSNRLIEEFMLLANISVAKKIYEDFPNLAFLRNHSEPNERLLGEVRQSLELVGLHLNTESSGALSMSLAKYNTGGYWGAARFTALNHLLTKPMNRAEYFCTYSLNPDSFHHYALSVPIYTHFTSPIRRYADVVVHRLLAASLGYSEKPKWDFREMDKIAKTCNAQKYNAKKAGEASCDLYMAHYIEHHQPFIVDAVIVFVQEKSFDAIVMQTGSVVRVYENNLEPGAIVRSETHGLGEKRMWKWTVIFPPLQHLPQIVQVAEIFQIVRLTLKRKPKTYKLDARLERPLHMKPIAGR